MTSDHAKQWSGSSLRTTVMPPSSLRTRVGNDFSHQPAMDSSYYDVDESRPLPWWLGPAKTLVPSKYLMGVGKFLGGLAEEVHSIGELFVRSHADKNKLHIPGSILVFWNPKAHNGDTKKFVAALFRTLNEMQQEGDLKIDGSVVIRPTNKDPNMRIGEIVAEIEVLLKEHPGQRVAVVGIGGDRTANDMTTAVIQVYKDHAADESRPDVVAVAGPGGTANDVRRMTGVPSDAKKLIRFLGSAVVTQWRGVELEFVLDNGEIERGTTFHGTTWGQSGEMFRALEEKRNEKGSFSVFDALSMLPRVLLNAKTMYVDVVVNGKPLNNGKRIATAEIFGPMVTDGLGMVTKFPLPAEGARIMLTPRKPWALITVSEAFLRGILVLMGFQHVIDPDGHLITMSKERNVDVLPGDVVTMRFSDKDGKPSSIAGTMAGDAHKPVREINVVGMEEPIPFLTSPNADLRVQQGLATPSLPGGDITNGVIGSMVYTPIEQANYLANQMTSSQFMLSATSAMMGGFFMGVHP